MTDDEMRACIKRAREIAQLIGPMHSYWDVISDAEAILDGRPSILPRETIEAEFMRMFPQEPKP